MIQSKLPFEYIYTALGCYSQNFKKFIEWNAPSPLWKFLSPKVTGKPKRRRRRRKKMHFILIQSKIPFGCTKSVALRYYFQIFTKSYWAVLKKAHFTSPAIWKFLSPNVTENPPKIHLILIHSKIPFECTESLVLGCYSQDLTKNYRVVLRKVHFTSPPIWNFQVQEYQQNPQKSIFDSIKNSFWVGYI